MNLSISEAVKRILFVGNTVPNSPFMLDESFKNLCAEHDLCVFNMEGSFSDSQKPLLKAGPHLLLNKKHFGPILECFNVATLANNHSMDFDIEGLQTTIELCNKNGIATVGAGMNLKEAFLPLDIGNCRIISVAENEFGAAQENKAGIATVDRPLELYRSIKEGREAGKFVVVVAHGGTETIPIPPPYLRKHYKSWIEYGADLIIGNHIDVVQGHERHKGKSIFYSLGNFAFFNDSFKEYSNDGWSVVVSIDITTGDVRAIPVSSDQNRSIHLSSHKIHVEEFQRLCAILNFSDYESMYEQIAEEKRSRLAATFPEEVAAKTQNTESTINQAFGQSSHTLVKQRLTESNISECQTRFNLTYHVPYAHTCQRLVGFEGKDVLEVGGSLPKDFIFDYLNVRSWSAVESPDYDDFTKEVGRFSRQSRLGLGGSIHNNMDDHSGLGFNDRDRNSGKYNLFFANIEDLPPEHHEKYDLIFSIACFEHINKFPLALEKMFLALKPKGQLFTMFSPIWSAYDGHHLPKITDKQGNGFSFANSPIPPWGHLLMRPPELCRYLNRFTDKKTADLIAYYVYNSNHINRFFTEDYVEFIKQARFVVKKLEFTFLSRIDKQTQETLERLYHGRTHFVNNGILVILERP